MRRMFVHTLCLMPCRDRKRVVLCLATDTRWPAVANFRAWRGSPGLKRYGFRLLKGVTCPDLASSEETRKYGCAGQARDHYKTLDRVLHRDSLPGLRPVGG